MAAHGIRLLGTCAKTMCVTMVTFATSVLETNRTWAISLLGFAVPYEVVMLTSACIIIGIHRSYPDLWSLLP